MNYTRTLFGRVTASLLDLFDRMSSRHARKTYAILHKRKSFEAKNVPHTHHLTPETILENLQPSPLENPPPILRLPVELLQEISSYLPVHSKALVSLTCKNILYILGNASWTDPNLSRRLNGGYLHVNGLHAETQDRVKFLKTLARDTSHLSYCARCKILHPNLPKPEDWRLKKKGESACLVADGVMDWFPRQEEKGYTLVWEHVKKAFEAHEAGMLKSSVLDAKYCIQQTRRLRTMTYSIMLGAQSVGRNMIFKQSHRFTGDSLTADDVLDFPLRICPHLTTFTALCGSGSGMEATSRDITRAKLYWDAKERMWCFPKMRRDNSPLLTHAINTAFPKSKRYTETLGKRRFREPYAREESQMFAKRKPDEFWWCRSCSTKFRIVYSEEGGLLVTVYQNFGADEHVARYNFGYLIRREVGNWEFGSLSRTFPDFDCEKEDIEEEQANMRGNPRVAN